MFIGLPKSEFHQSINTCPLCNYITPAASYFLPQLTQNLSISPRSLRCDCKFLDMDVEQLCQQAAQMRASLFEQGVLNNNFLNVEDIEAGQPNFVEHMIATYFSSSNFLNELRQAMETKPLNMCDVERLIMKLKGGSGMMGLARFYAIVSLMGEALKRGELYRLYEEFQRVSAEHAVLKSQLQPYAEILRLLREAGPPAPAPASAPAPALAPAPAPAPALE